MKLGLLSASHDVDRSFWIEDRGLDRVEIEIGPGNGGFLRAAALADPRTLFVGIEILPGSLARARRGGPLPPNLHLLEGDGGWMVRNLLAPGSIDAFHVYFPDPWWKKRHHKRRLFQAEFCEAVGRVLAPGAGMHVVTDVVPLFTEIRENMETAGFRAESWIRTDGDIACSSYEKKYRQQGRRFEAAVFRKPVNSAFTTPSKD
jgi:tRNA (guanine-N7-)-methyltransferase